MKPSYCEPSYRVPPDQIRKIYDTPPSPFIYFVPFNPTAIEFNYENKTTLKRLAEPSAFLAGEKFSIRLNTSLTHYPKNSITIHHLNENRIIPVDLPQEIRIRDYQISPDNQKLAISVESDLALDLYIIQLENGISTKIKGIKLNDIFSDEGFWWTQDSQKIIAKTLVNSRGKPPVKSLVPESPIIEETSGKFSTNRTYQYLLKDNFDKILFEYYFTSQLVKIDLRTGKITELGNSAIIDQISVSPDENYFLIEKIIKPYSYQVPHYRFPRRYELWDKEGNFIVLIQERALQDEIPIGGTYKGPRRFKWQALKPASLIWMEALDEGDPKVEVDYRDKLMRWEAPFRDNPQELLRTNDRFFDLKWSETKDEMIYSEYDRDRLWIKVWLYNIGDKEAKLLFDLSIKDIYNQPGDIVSKPVPGNMTVFIKKNGRVFFNNSVGASKEGIFPHLSSYDLKTGKTEKIFSCRDQYFEKPLEFIDQEMTKLAISSENPESPRNYFIFDLQSQAYHPVTSYLNPYPEITSLEKELIQYKRQDDVLLSGLLYLPPDRDPNEKLPLIIHAYPEEYTDVSTAGQLRTSPYKFTRFWGASVKYLALSGYAVLVNASIPIIGDPETVNDNFLTQLVSSIQAAVDHLDAKEIIDRDRVGIIGHSYGAFMVANLLAHSDVCQAGVAKSGAYNRTLTPFGFQSERRTLWQAREFYVKVSPYLFADQIKEPMLLIHGENDPNSGTYPMQSRRMFQALKGHGATAKLVILPFEEHGYRARESNLHVLAEIIEWFDRYVKSSENE